jgi:hypothetical protein
MAGSSESKIREDKLVPPSGVSADFSPIKKTAPAEAVSAEIDEYLQESVLAEELYAKAIAMEETADEGQKVLNLLRAAKQAEKAQEWHIAAISLHAMADIFRSKGPERDLDRAIRFYRRAIAAYESCGHFDEASALEYRVGSIRLWNARELKHSLGLRIELFLYWATAGFGYRPLRVIGSSIVMILAFGLIYWVTGGVLGTNDDDETVVVKDFGSAAYFSGSTFLTINYGDLLPAEHVRWVTVLEGLAGLTMSSFFVVVLVNRLRH